MINKHVFFCTDNKKAIFDMTAVEEGTLKVTTANKIEDVVDVFEDYLRGCGFVFNHLEIT